MTLPNRATAPRDHPWLLVAREAGSHLSSLAIGTSALGTYELAAPVYDAFTEHGGNVFDTAWVYGEKFGAGCCERALGAWLESRACSDEVFIFAKGGHPPRCRPELLAGDLSDSLDRLGLSSVAVYMPHRDDEMVPVGEFVDALVALVDAGWVRAYGFSNWTPNRYVRAAAYAAERGLPPPVALSNHMSLAEMVNPIYPGVCSVGAKDRQWLTATKTPLVAWSSQARGLFVQAVKPSDVYSAEIAMWWGSPDNEARLARAQQLAVERGVSPVNVALAWVLQQPFPTLPIIGPRSADDTVDCLRALTIALSVDDVEWLWSGGRHSESMP